MIAISRGFTPRLIGELLGPHSIPFLGDTIIKETPSGQSKRFALFKCKCGNTFECNIRTVMNGTKTNCGCGAISGRQKHGLTGTKIRRCWAHIKVRCFIKTSKAYEFYGARGITLYEPWVHDFKAFYSYVVTLPGWDNPALSIDRRDNDGNYEPGNLRWATKSEQALNRRPKKRK